MRRRQNMLLRSSDGDYYPSFFTIKLDIKNLDQSFVPNCSSTFIHEYIHFIQDLILPYCIRVNLSNIRFFNNICNYGKKNEVIPLPFKEWEKDAYSLKKQFEFTFGSGKAKRISIEGISKPEKYTFTGYDPYNHKNRDLNVYMYKLNFINGSSYQLGARDLLEYISYRIESKFFYNGNSFPDYPYKTFDILMDYLGYSKMSIEKRVVIAEICLHNDNPMHFFFEIFHNKNFIKNIIHLPVDRIPDYLYRNIEFRSVDNINESFKNKEIRRLNDFITQLSAEYNHSEFIVKWLQIINNYSKDRFQGSLIFSYLYNLDNNEFKQTINEIISELGFPIVINKNEQILNNSISDSPFLNELEYFYLMDRFLNFTEGNVVPFKDCPIKNFCKQNYQHTCNKKCDENRNELNCPFIKFLKSNGIDTNMFKKTKA